MFKKEILIIFIGLCVVVAMLVLVWSVFVKTEVPVRAPVVSDEEVVDDVEDDDVLDDGDDDDISEIDTSGWNAYWNEKFGFEVKYPEDWEYKEHDNAIYFGAPESKSGGYIWGVSIYQSNELEKEIMQMGNQFDDRKEIREEVTINEDISGIIVTVTTDKHIDWISKKVYFEKNDKLFAIGNGAIADDRFKTFYSSFKFMEKDNTVDWKAYWNEEFGFELEYPSSFYLFDCSKSFDSFPSYICLTPYVKDDCNSSWKSKMSAISVSVVKDFNKNNAIGSLDENIKEEKIIIGNKAAIQISGDREVVGDEGEKISSAPTREMVYTIIPFENNISIKILYHRIVGIKNNANGFYVGKDLSDAYDHILSTFKFTNT